MTLEELVYQWLTENPKIVEKMAVYAGKPAIFFQLAPDDCQTGWGSKTQYPRMSYQIDMQANQERKSVGMMSICLFCDETGIPPEEIELVVRECFKDLIIQPDQSSPYCFAWARTDNFEMKSLESGANTRVIGVEIQFDLLEYPGQETTDPDPIIALQRYLKHKIPESFVLGLEQMDFFLIADAKEPIFYCRLESIAKTKETNTVTWLEGELAIHVICPDFGMRLKTITSIVNQLAQEGEIILLDQSPMTIKQLKTDNQADYLKEGQIFLTVQYGLLRYQSKPHKIDRIDLEVKGEKHANKKNIGGTYYNRIRVTDKEKRNRI